MHLFVNLFAMMNACTAPCFNALALHRPLDNAFCCTQRQAKTFGLKTVKQILFLGAVLCSCASWHGFLLRMPGRSKDRGKVKFRVCPIVDRGITAVVC